MIGIFEYVMNKAGKLILITFGALVLLSGCAPKLVNQSAQNVSLCINFDESGDVDSRENFSSSDLFPRNCGAVVFRENSRVTTRNKAYGKKSAHCTAIYSKRASVSEDMNGLRVVFGPAVSTAKYEEWTDIEANAMTSYYPVICLYKSRNLFDDEGNFLPVDNYKPADKIRVLYPFGNLACNERLISIDYRFAKPHEMLDKVCREAVNVIKQNDIKPIKLKVYRKK